MQSGLPITFYSRKLNKAQQRYPVIELELLSIVETLKEHQNMLLGHKIKIFTDHKNLTFSNFTTERVYRWRLLVEEHGPEINYIPGQKNVLADALSRLPTRNNDPEAPIEPEDTEIDEEIFAITDEDPVLG